MLRDGDGSFYGMLATVLPGFRWFRFPSKLLSFSAMAVAGLAGLGWDRLESPAALSVIGLAGATLGYTAIVAVLRRAAAVPRHMPFGPLNPEGAFSELQRRRCPRFAAALMLVVATIDLGAANHRLVLTVPQALLERKPRAVALIEVTERAAALRGEAQVGPFRVHRLPTWYPEVWEREAIRGRVAESVGWGCDSIEAKFGLMHGIQYTMTLGLAETYDYECFFGAHARRVNAAMARVLSLKPGSPVVVFPRRALDLWNSPYFVVPARPNGWDDESRGYASLLAACDRLCPAGDAFLGPDGAERSQRRSEREDFQVFRNRAAYPRTWVVHDARFANPIAGLEGAERVAWMSEIMYSAEPLWTERGRPGYDPRLLAWLDSDQREALAAYLSGSDPPPSESPRITHYGSQRVEIDVVLAGPGLVVLADLYYPGWRLTIDGTKAPIYRAKSIMRAAAVPAVKHHLVYS